VRRVVPFLVFFAIVCSLLAAIHYYLWLRLVRDLAFAPGVEWALSLAAAALFISVPLTLVLGRLLPRERAKLLLGPVYTWMGTMWVLLVAVAAVDLVRFLVETLGAGSDVGVLQAQTYPIAAAVIGVSATLFALGHGARFRIQRVEVPLGKLPRELDGFRIAQLSDVHVGPSIGRDFIERVVQTVNELKPDAIVITGDLVDGSVDNLSDAVAPLADLEAPHGKFFVTGNHEYYSGAPAWCQHLRALGFRVLRNERVALGAGEAHFDLAGVDDHSARGFGNGHGADLDKALSGRDASRALVLLAHQPRAVFEARQKGVDLQLSGHTHGGQIWPFHWFVRLQQPVVAGLHRLGETQLYVSRGTGYWGPPMRLLAPAEVTEIVLRAA
jgi:predicted MPP superfamily phosphohydrolase